MEFALHWPKAPLDRHVESLTFYAGYAPAHQREKLIPDGAIQIIVDLTERPKRLYASETGAAGVDFHGAWVSGMQKRWIVIEAQPKSSMLIIRFRPGGAYAFLRHDAEALTGGVYPLVEIAGAAGSLRDRILEAPEVAGKFAAAEAWLIERAGDFALNPAVEHIARRLRRPMGLRVGDLADEVGFSERHLLGLCRRWIGVSPKQFARIGRFQQLLGTLAETGTEDVTLTGAPLPPPDWAKLAMDGGYADQSHLSHEFIAFAGMTPGAYARAYRGLSNYLPIVVG